MSPLDRVYVTYCDDVYAQYARMSLRSVLQTQRLERLVVLHPTEVESGGPFERLLDRLRLLDERVVAACADSIAPGVALRKVHPLLYSDLLRSYVYDAYGSALWFDSDMLMLADISHVFEWCDASHLSAAADPPATQWSAILQEFMQAVAGEMTGDAESFADPGLPMNCGLLYLNSSELSRLFLRGLSLSNQFCERGLGARKPHDDALTALSIGQLAWNYVFAAVPCATVLAAEYNWAPPAPAVDPPPRARPDARVVHYIGAHRKRSQMADDYEAWFPDEAVARDGGVE